MMRSPNDQLSNFQFFLDYVAISTANYLFEDLSMTQGAKFFMMSVFGTLSLKQYSCATARILKVTASLGLANHGSVLCRA